MYVPTILVQNRENMSMTEPARNTILFFIFYFLYLSEYSTEPQSKLCCGCSNTTDTFIVPCQLGIAKHQPRIKVNLLRFIFPLAVSGLVIYSDFRCRKRCKNRLILSSAFTVCPNEAYCNRNKLRVPLIHRVHLYLTDWWRYQLNSGIQ